MTTKRCFFNAERPCDLTCKAAFEVDDPVDNVDCHFIWLAYHLGEGAVELKRMLEGFGGDLGGLFGGAGPAGPAPGGGFMGGGPPKKGSPSNN